MINYRTKQLLDLGKGCWWALRDNPEYLLYKEGIREVMEDYDYFGPDQSAENIIYWNQVIDLIWDFIKDENPEDIDIVSDSGDDTTVLYTYGYRYSGNRYYLSDPIKNKQEILERNAGIDRRYKLHDKDSVVDYFKFCDLKRERL